MTERSLLVKQLKCLPCEIEGKPQPFVTEAHHTNLGGFAGQKRMGDAFQLPCCSWHHRAVRLPGMTNDQMTHKYGPSLALDSRQYRLAYGVDSILLQLTNNKLAQLLPESA